MPSQSGREVSSEAIILRSKSYREDDLLVDFLSLESGRISGVARHGKKSHKRFGTVLEPLNILRLRYLEKGGVWVTLTEASLQIPLAHLRMDFERLMTAFYLLDVIRQSIHERSPEPKLYALLKDSLCLLNSGGNPRGVVERFEETFLDLCGYRPSLQACLSCRKPVQEGERFCFVFREGGIFCAGCLPEGTSHEVFSLKNQAKIFSRFIEYQLGRPLKSGRFLHGVI